ncbi:Arc family DNA-binding protein [Methylobacterium dankookense]|uniref:Arc-like DNA binding domain-containing protein n=1 Tax=Methylobacterium dankookense TaxID=560405 RepID=A0A564G535_9HYPH|nr:Arc family DNA-binding protein [Methylobacterium dankookense]GJD58352.1 hypothetical protein IFDJLNFL_4271 [Methylobacterium dankookense]VUF15643.1 hypothetical protein MTDSW087_05387 [Methylobacterium dankookense]
MSDREPYPSDLAERFQLRMPTGLRDRVKAEAETNKRSMNAEIIARLELTLQIQDQAADPSYARRSRKDLSDLDKIKSEYDFLGSHLDALGRRIQMLEADLIPYYAAQTLKPESETE